ncbi:sugar-binding protein [Saccharicrinis sp. FJH62]|uniref:sugar-binding protein n=1 Tax=Saccharicrinis sp. FJH62 TaxID=3344657 RepID=UPI0035D505EA
MRKTFTILAAFLVGAFSFAQQPEAVFTRLTDTAPVLDGEIDAVWDNATKYDIDKDYTGETPTVGASYFKGMYADSGIFVLVYVDDDVLVPWYAQTGGDEWTYDKAEVYFDVNEGDLADGQGPSTGGTGHYQFAPSITEENANGALTEESNYRYALKTTDPSYTIEYFIPFSTLVDKSSFVMAQTAEFGFDVYISDRDAAGDAGSRQRKVWANIGTVGENWGNMNDAGLVTLADPSDLIYVDEITLTPSSTTIDVNNGTIQLTTEIVPGNATNKELKYYADPANAVTISSTGLVKAVRDGEVTIYASSTDGGYIDSDPVTITITNQILTADEANLIVNGNFDTDLSAWGGWVDAESGETYVWEDGVVKCVTVAKAENWHYQFNQTNMFHATPNIPYIYKFKAWASKVRVATTDFEDNEANGYNRYGASSSEGNVDGRSEWLFELQTEPTWYEYEVTFDQITETTPEKVQFLLSIDDGTVYIDSVSLISKADTEILGVETGLKKVNTTKFNMYPNPVGHADILNVEVAGKDTNVSVYSIAGHKVAEQRSVNGLAKINVSQLSKGLYLIRLDDGSTQKFIR